MTPRKARRRGPSASESDSMSWIAISALFFASVAVVYVCVRGLPVDVKPLVSSATNFNASAVTARVSEGVRVATKFVNETRLKLASKNVTAQAVGLFWTTLETGQGLWEISSLRHALISAFCGGFLVLYGWYILYWDSYIPGAFPKSPEWPWKYSGAAGDCITLNHWIVILMGPVAAARMYRELHGSWELF